MTSWLEGELTARGCSVYRFDSAVVVRAEWLNKPIVFRIDASQRLVYGLCKKYGIKLPKGTEPPEAWKILEEKVGKSPEEFFTGAEGSFAEVGVWKRTSSEVSVKGPKECKKFIKNYAKKHPEIVEKAKKYKGVLAKVKNFTKDNPDAEDGTYSATTGKMVDVNTGYCVTFHQNYTTDNVFGGYDDDDYATMSAIAVNELESKDVYIGYFGNPEVSFNCSSFEKAMVFAVDHNQHSIYDCDAGRVVKNPYYNPKKNPIEGHS